MQPGAPTGLRLCRRLIEAPASPRGRLRLYLEAGRRSARCFRGLPVLAGASPLHWIRASLTGERILMGRSHWLDCHCQLKALDLVALFSWLLCLGACRYCGKPALPA
ncbi:MAG: prepilin peptidase [Rhodomicrobium sp.]